MNKDINKVLEIKPESEAQQSSKQITEGIKYPALRTISEIYKALSIIIGFVAFIAFVYGLWLFEQGYRSKATGTSLIISSLIAGIVGVIAFLAISEVIKLFIDLESNSRKQIILLHKILDKK